MKLRAGGKPWRRKPSAAPQAIAARTPAPVRLRESAITAIVAPEIAQTPAARPSTPSVKLMTLITATMPMIVRTCARSARPSTGRWNRKAVCGLIPPANGTLNVPTFTPLKTGIATATTWPASLRPAFSSKTSSSTPSSAIAKAPARIARATEASGRNRSPAASTPTSIASPPSRGIGFRWMLRSFG